MADRIDVRGLSGCGRHGVYDHERAEGQRFVVDLALWLDTRAAAAADELSATVDYGSLAGQVVDLIEGEPVALIETLAPRIRTLCLTEPGNDTGAVTEHKPDEHIPGRFQRRKGAFTR